MPTSLTEEEVEDVYAWVDQVPLSRPKRNISRDFSDGVLMAEAVTHFYPKLVEMHNYSAANAHAQKLYNWTTLNKKVLKRLGITLTAKEMEDACNCVPMVIEGILFKLQSKVADDKARLDSSGGRRANGSAPAHPNPRSRPAVPSPSARSPNSAPHFFDAGGMGGGGGGMGMGGGGQLGGARKAAPSPGSRGMREQADLQREVDTEILIEKEQQIVELQDTVAILESKVQKLEQLLKLKDAKIHALTARLQH